MHQPGVRAEQLSRFHGTFFTGVRIPIGIAIQIILLTVLGNTHTQIMKVTGLFKQTVTDFMSFTRQLLAENIDEEKMVIDGEDKEVQVDESKFTKRKYHRGHRLSQSGRQEVDGGRHRVGPTPRRVQEAVIHCNR